MATSNVQDIEKAFSYYNQLNIKNGYKLQLHCQVSPMTMENEYAVSEWDADQKRWGLVATHLTIEELIPLVKMMQPDHPLIT